MAKNVATREETRDLALPPMDFAADAGAGQEGADADSYAVPFLIVLQSNSPAVEEVEGAKPGMIYNTITGELFTELLFIPCAFRRRFLRWAPRSQGGGFKGEYNPIDVETGAAEGLTKANGQYLMDVPEGATTLFDEKGAPLYDHLKDTRMHFVLYHSPETDSWHPALMSLASTQIKKSRRLMSRIQGIELRDQKTGRSFNPPSFSHIYHATTVKEENNQGKWHGINFDLNTIVDDPELYAKARAFYQSVTAGEVQVNPPEEDPVRDVSGGAEEGF